MDREMADFIPYESPKMVKRLNATLPPKLAMFVGEVTGEDGLYETPSELVRDLIRRYMETVQTTERREINALLRRSMAENMHTSLDIEQDAVGVLNSLKGNNYVADEEK